MNRVAIYTRVSKGEQDAEKQLVDLRSHAERMGWEIALEVTETVSGQKAARPEREKVIKATRCRAVDTVLVWKLDRFGRSLSDLVMTLEEFRRRKINFVSLTDGIDITTPMGWAMTGMLAVFAEFEYNLIAERSAAGVAHARSKGVQFGRTRTASYHSDQVLALDAEGKNHSEIARTCKISRASVIRILRSSGVTEK